MIIWGMPARVPLPSSIRRSILGTITAGDTAATTLPHDGCVQHRDAQQARRKQHHSGNLEAGRHEAEQHGGPSGPLQVGKLQVQARAR